MLWCPKHAAILVLHESSVKLNLCHGIWDSVVLYKLQDQYDSPSDPRRPQQMPPTYYQQRSPRLPQYPDEPQVMQQLRQDAQTPGYETGSDRISWNEDFRGDKQPAGVPNSCTF
jgi:hypothetical protein